MDVLVNIFRKNVFRYCWLGGTSSEPYPNIQVQAQAHRGVRAYAQVSDRWLHKHP